MHYVCQTNYFEISILCSCIDLFLAISYLKTCEINYSNRKINETKFREKYKFAINQNFKVNIIVINLHLFY